MTRVLITGVAGFIGSNLARECIERNWVVDGVDDMSNGHVEFIPDGLNFFMLQDFASEKVLSRVSSGCYDYVFHLAAVPMVSYSVERPLETNDVNVTKTLALMDACKGRIKRFVFASSSAVYGLADTLPTSETCKKSPKSPYGLQKSIIEDYLKLYYELYGLDSVALRFFNVFGRNQLGGSPYSTAISAWLTAIKKGQSMRSDGDGSQSRDMCHVDNVVDACIRSALHAQPLQANVFNVACGSRTTNLEILEYLRNKYPDVAFHNAPWRVGDVMHTQASIAKINEVLGYIPVVEIWDGIDKTAAWYDANWEWIKDVGRKDV